MLLAKCIHVAGAYLLRKVQDNICSYDVNGNVSIFLRHDIPIQEWALNVHQLIKQKCALVFAVPQEHKLKSLRINITHWPRNYLTTKSPAEHQSDGAIE